MYVRLYGTNHRRWAWMYGTMYSDHVIYHAIYANQSLSYHACVDVICKVEACVWEGSGAVSRGRLLYAMQGTVQREQNSVDQGPSLRIAKGHVAVVSRVTGLEEPGRSDVFRGAPLARSKSKWLAAGHAAAWSLRSNLFAATATDQINPPWVGLTDRDVLAQEGLEQEFGGQKGQRLPEFSGMVTN